MNVTFDSNVWEKVVGNAVSHFAKIKDKICTGEIHPYICEVALSLESIKKKKRAEFFKNYKPSIKCEYLPTEDGIIRMQMSIEPNNELHPGFNPKLREKLLKARDLGFRVLRMINLGTVRAKEIPDKMCVGDVDQKYIESLATCSEYITSLGCGQAMSNQLKETFNRVDFNSQGIPSEFEKRFQEAVAEWVDGDSLAAHYASGNEWFCTDDQAGNAGIGSIFHSQNRARVEKKFGNCLVQFVRVAKSVQHRAQLLATEDSTHQYDEYKGTTVHCSYCRIGN